MCLLCVKPEDNEMDPLNYEGVLSNYIETRNSIELSDKLLLLS